MQTVEEQEEYSLMRISYNNDVEVLSLIKKWLPDISIVDNKPLEDKLDEILQKYLDRD